MSVGKNMSRTINCFRFIFLRLMMSSRFFCGAPPLPNPQRSHAGLRASDSPQNQFPALAEATRWAISFSSLSCSCAWIRQQCTKPRAERKQPRPESVRLPSQGAIKKPKAAEDKDAGGNQQPWAIRQRIWRALVHPNNVSYLRLPSTSVPAQRGAEPQPPGSEPRQSCRTASSPQTRKGEGAADVGSGDGLSRFIFAPRM
jgi:hypothetical protein